jgi:FSR family fosmidomycin resistance protein-like MFS transporter
MSMHRRAVAVLSAGHLFTDLNQGAMPAMLPFFVAEYHLTYQQAAGLVFAATVASSVVQPLFGNYADRTPARWLMPVGVLVAGLGMALTGAAGNYWLMAGVLMLSSLGVAAFHPEAARTMNAAAGERKATGMSVFSMGGSGGFALGPLLATALMLNFGVRGSLLLAIPAVGMALVLFNQLRRLPRLAAARPHLAETGAAGPRDAWAPFSRLIAAVIFRSIIFFGFNTFLSLYWINYLGQSPATGGAVLALWLLSALAGALIGGRLSDRYGARQVGLATSLVIVPLLVGFVSIPHPVLAAGVVAAIGTLLAMPSSGLMVLGQELLPNHIGVASGVTIGLSVSVGGATAPLLGWLADHYGIPAALVSLAVLPLLIALLLWTLPRWAHLR